MRYLLISILLPVLAACSTSHGGSDASGDTGARPDEGTPDVTPPPPPTSYDRCAVTSDCVLTATECCQSCERWTTSDVAAINEARRMDHFDEVACPDGPPPCPRCAALPNPNLIASCEDASQCRVIDIENDPFFARCATDAECKITAPACCQCGADTSPENLVAIRVDRSLSEVLCDPMVACPDCEPLYPPSVRARCDPALGLCRVVIDFEP